MDKIKSILEYLSVIKDLDVIFASLSTYIAYLLNCTWLLGIFIGILVLIVVYAILRRNMKKAGIRKNRCELIPYLRFKILNRNESVVYYIHKELYHKLFEIKSKFNQLVKDNPNIDIESCESQFRILLNTFHSFLYEVFNLDLTISIFMLYKESDNIVLRRLFIHRSKVENKRTMQRDSKKNKVKPYFIRKLDDESTEQENITIEKIRDIAEDFINDTGNGKFKKNSAFDFVLSSNEQIWISNNLNKDVFYSSSKNYKTFYNSLAAVAISHPVIDKIERKSIKGILAFDSLKTNIFSEKECYHIMALMAHFLNEIFEEFESNKNDLL